MRANIPPRGFESLTEYQKDNLRKWQQETIMELTMKQIDHEEAEMQKIWIGYACMILHESFGFGKTRCKKFIGTWKRFYRLNSTLNTKEKQQEFLKNGLSFFGDEYPEDFIDSLERIGDYGAGK